MPVQLEPGSQLVIRCQPSSHFCPWVKSLQHFLGAYQAPLSWHHEHLPFHIPLSSITVLSSFTIFTLNLHGTPRAAEGSSAPKWIPIPPTCWAIGFEHLILPCPFLMEPISWFSIRYEASSPFCYWSIYFHHYFGSNQVPLPTHHGNAPFRTLFSSITILSSFTIFTLNRHANLPSAKTNSVITTAERTT